MVRLVNEEQPIIAQLPMLVREAGKTKVVKFKQLAKARSPQEVTVLGTVSEVPAYPAKAYPSKAVIEGLLPQAIVPVAPLKAYALIVVTESGIETAVRELHPEKAFEGIAVMEFDKVMVSKLRQPENADSPMAVTESGIDKEAPKNLWNAYCPIVVTFGELPQVIDPEAPPKAFTPIERTESATANETKEEQPLNA